MEYNKNNNYGFIPFWRQKVAKERLIYIIMAVLLIPILIIMWHTWQPTKEENNTAYAYSSTYMDIPNITTYNNTTNIYNLKMSDYGLYTGRNLATQTAQTINYTWRGTYSYATGATPYQDNTYILYDFSNLKNVSTIVIYIYAYGYGTNAYRDTLTLVSGTDELKGYIAYTPSKAAITNSGIGGIQTIYNLTETSYYNTHELNNYIMFTTFNDTPNEDYINGYLQGITESNKQIYTAINFSNAMPYAYTTTTMYQYDSTTLYSSGSTFNALSVSTITNTSTDIQITPTQSPYYTLLYLQTQIKGGTTITLTYDTILNLNNGYLLIIGISNAGIPYYNATSITASSDGEYTINVIENTNLKYYYVAIANTNTSAKIVNYGNIKIIANANNDYTTSIANAYENGYNYGYEKGKVDGQNIEFTNTNVGFQLLESIFTLPVNIITEWLDFEILGINFLAIFKAIITFVCIGFIVRTLL